MKPQRLFRPVLVLALLVTLSRTVGVSTPFTASAQDNVYYVDQNHPQASDSNPGSEDAPWLTIQHAADVVSAGDTVYVKAGFYPERVEPQSSGASGNTITFKAQPRRSVTMYGFYTVSADYLRIEGFNITTDESLTGWTERYGVFIRSDHVEVIDNYFYDLKAAAIQGYWHEPYPEAAYVARNTVYHSQKGIGVTGFDWVVEENEFDGVSRPQGAGWDIGAYEFHPTLALHGAPGDQLIHLTWTVNTTLPVTSTWQIDYYSQIVTAPLSITGIISPTRAYSLTGLTNYTWYTVTLYAMLDSTPFLTNTARVMPTDIFAYLPIVLKGP